jgi:formate dehydrogenase
MKCRSEGVGWTRALTLRRLVVTDDKEGPQSAFQKHIVDADVLVTTPFHPAYLTEEIMKKAKNLKLCVTAGVGSE